jgi:hypothetical protein
VNELLSETYGLLTVNPDAVADKLGDTMGLPVERHRSVYYGDYSLCRAAGRGIIRVCFNRDPLFRPEIHPPDERFLRPQFPADWILVEAERVDAGELGQLREALRSCFPEAVLLQSSVTAEE